MSNIVTTISISELDGLMEANKNRVLGRIAFDPNIRPDVSLRVVKDQIAETLRDSLVVALKTGDGHCEGAMFVQKSVFDTTHFGFGVGKLRLGLFTPGVSIEHRRELVRAMREVARQANLDVVFARVAADDILTIQSLELEGGVTADVLNTYSMDLTGIERRSVDAEPVHPSDAHALEKIARRIFTLDHFHGDSRLAREKSDELFGKWIFNSVLGGADATFKTVDNGVPVGFITCRLVNVVDNIVYGVIELVGVDRNARNRGIASSLVAAALQWFASQGANSVYAGTQAANIPAARLYEKAGFRLAYCEVTIHLWI
jgi:ribosomal protein S18 acetylase RimI-like enzyme